MQDIWEIIRTVVVVILGIPLVIIGFALYVILLPFCIIFGLTPRIKLHIGKSEYAEK